MAHFSESTATSNEHFPFARSSAVVYRAQPSSQVILRGGQMLANNGGADFSAKTWNPSSSKLYSASHSQQTPRQSFPWQHPSNKRRTLNLKKSRCQQGSVQKQKNKSEEYLTNLWSLSARNNMQMNMEAVLSQNTPLSSQSDYAASSEFWTRKWSNPIIPGSSQFKYIPSSQPSVSSGATHCNYFGHQKAQSAITPKLPYNQNNIFSSASVDLLTESNTLFEHQQMERLKDNAFFEKQNNFHSSHYPRHENKNFNLPLDNSQPKSYHGYFFSPNPQKLVSPLNFQSSCTQKCQATKQQDLFPSLDEAFRKPDMSKCSSWSSPPRTQNGALVNKSSASDPDTSKLGSFSRWNIFSKRSPKLSPRVEEESRVFITEDFCQPSAGSKKINDPDHSRSFGSSSAKVNFDEINSLSNLTSYPHQYIPKNCESINAKEISYCDTFIQNLEQRFRTRENGIIPLIRPLAQSTPIRDASPVKRKLIVKDKSTQVHLPCGLKRCREE